MRSDGTPRAALALKLGAAAGLLFLHLPLALIFLYAFTSEEKSFQFPPPGYTTHWFTTAWFDRPDIWPPLLLSIKVALIAASRPSRRLRTRSIGALNLMASRRL